MLSCGEVASGATYPPFVTGFLSEILATRMRANAGAMLGNYCVESWSPTRSSRRNAARGARVDLAAATDISNLRQVKLRLVVSTDNVESCGQRIGAPWDARRRRARSLIPCKGLCVRGSGLQRV